MLVRLFRRGLYSEPLWGVYGKTPGSAGGCLLYAGNDHSNTGMEASAPISEDLADASLNVSTSSVMKEIPSSCSYEPSGEALPLGMRKYQCAEKLSMQL